MEVQDIVLANGVIEEQEEVTPEDTPVQTLHPVVQGEEAKPYNVPVPLTEIDGELPAWLESAPDLVPLLSARVVDPARQEAWPHSQEQTVAQLLDEQTVAQYWTQTKH